MSFNSIIGHNDIKSKLEGSIFENRVGHAYVFTGAQGVGKKTTAIAYSQLLLCNETCKNTREIDVYNRYSEPCGKCMACKTFEAGTNPDFTIIESSKSTISIDEIRQMQGDIIIKPIYSDKKVYIIVNAQKMTIQAQNCLLKTLEEPPGHSCIILTTSNYDSLLQTIKSRVQRVVFTPLDSELVMDYLNTHYSSNDISKEFVIAYSGGIIGKAIEILENDALKEIREKCFDYLFDNGKAWSEGADYFEENKDNINFILDMMDTIYRDMLLICVKSEKQLINSDKKDIIINNAGKWTVAKLTNVIGLIAKARGHIRMYVNTRLVIDNLMLAFREV